MPLLSIWVLFLLCYSKGTWFCFIMHSPYSAMQPPVR